MTSTLVISGKFKDCRRVQRIRLTQGLARVDLVTELRRYAGREELFAVTFPAALPGATPVFDDRFGCVVKRRSRGKLDYRTWQWRNYSDCGARRAHQWVDLSSAARLRFVEGEEECSSYGLGPMSLVVTEGLDEAVESLQTALAGRGVTSTIFRDDCERRRRCTLPREDSTMPLEHPNEDLPWGTAVRVIADVGDTNLLWQALRAELEECAVTCLEEQRAAEGAAMVFALDPKVPEGWPPLPTLVVTALTARGLQQRLGQLAGEMARTGALTLAAELDLSAERRRLPEWGLALLNRGTPLHSVEADGTMVLMLMHAVPWGRTAWGPDRLDFHLVAEHKTHRFEYALQAHEGDWRAGQTVRAGYEYNNPLQVMQKTAAEGGAVARELSYLEVEGGIMTALKPAGYGIARHDQPGDLPLVLRVYEPHGEPGRLRVKWPGGLAAAQRANMLDEAQEELETVKGQLEVDLRPFEIGSYLLTPRRQGKRVGRLVEREEGVLASRYWRHNVGEAPLGYVPVSITLGGEIQTDTHVKHGGYTVNELRVGVANNLRQTARGKVRLLVGEGWRTLPEEIEFEVPAQGGAEYRATLVFDSRRRAGVVRAQLQWEGQVYEDTLVVGEAPQPEWTARVKKDTLRVAVTNPGADVLNADLYLIAPHEAWASVPMRRAALALAAGETTELLVPLGFGGEYGSGDLWLVAKLAYRGQVEYRPIIL